MNSEDQEGFQLNEQQGTNPAHGDLTGCKRATGQPGLKVLVDCDEVKQTAKYNSLILNCSSFPDKANLKKSSQLIDGLP